jgi:hypothetical protein
MLKAAQELVPGATTVHGALATVASCDDIAASLTDFSSCDGQCTCDVECRRTLCGASVASRWATALDASAVSGSVGRVELKSSGDAKVDDVAAPASFAGLWKGTLSDGLADAAVSGQAEGAASVGEDTPPQ